MLIRFLIIIIFFSFNLGIANSQSCEQLNTNEFYENLSWGEEDPNYLDIFYKCLEEYNDRYIWLTDESGSIPLFKAIISEINPLFIDSFFEFVDYERWSQLLNKKDNRGRNALLVAVEEAPYYDTLLRILVFYFSIGEYYGDQAHFLKEKSLLEYAAEIEENEDIVATLIALDNDHDLDEETHFNTASDLNALLFQKSWKDKFLVQTNIIYKESGKQFADEKVLEDCTTIIEPKVLENLTPYQLQNCILKNFNVRSVSKDGDSLLHLISRYSKYPELIDLVLVELNEKAQDEALFQTDAKGYTPIHVAALHTENPAIVTRLIAWGADPNVGIGYKKISLLKKLNPLKNKKKTRPIHLAASRETEFAGPILNRLFAGGADAFAKDEKGNSFLHIILKSDYTFPSDVSLGLLVQDMQMNMLRKKIPEIKNDKGATPLLLAAKCKNGKFDNYEHCSASDKGATPVLLPTKHKNEKTYTDGQVNEKHYWAILELISFGADPDAENKEGWTPLMLYSLEGQDADTFKLLLDHSEKPCDAKIKKGKLEGTTTLAALKENKALLERKTFDGMYPLSLFKQRCPN